MVYSFLCIESSLDNIFLGLVMKQMEMYTYVVYNTINIQDGGAPSWAIWK